MKQTIFQIALLVNDYDEAIDFYTKKLHFELLEDTNLNETKRWVRVAPKNSTGLLYVCIYIVNFIEGCSLLLAKASDDIQKSRVGNQTGGRVFLFLETDDIQRDFKDFKENGIRFIREPSQEDYGTVAVFEDLYGNSWDMIQRPIK